MSEAAVVHCGVQCCMHLSQWQMKRCHIVRRWLHAVW